MSILDHLVVLLVTVGMPLNQALGRTRLSGMLDFRTSQRVALYRGMMAVEWVATGLLLLAWWRLGRPFADLGLRFDFTARFWAASGLALASVACAAHYYRRQLGAPDRRARLRQRTDRLAPFLPRSREAMPAFDGLAVTAGICEEIVYRGFFIWYASRAFGDSAAALATSVIVTAGVFGLGHLYQGRSGMLLVFSTGLLFGGLYVLSGSLWVPMALHATVDMIGGRISRKLHGDGDSAGSLP